MTSQEVRQTLATALSEHARSQHPEYHIQVDKLAFALSQESPELFERLAQKVSTL